MISRKITETDLFLDMPLSSQCFYFHLNMGADDEGFIDNVKTIQRMVGASNDDLSILIAKNFLIPFESGVVVIKDWKIHNYIAKDRFTKTLHQEERSQITLDENNSYTNCIHGVYGLHSQSSKGLDKGSKDKSSNTLVESKDGTKGKGSKAYDNDFEQLWKLYPKKQGKPDALRHYKKAIKDGVTNEEIEQGIKDYVEQIEINKTERQFIKLGSTWFSKKGWEDEYDTKDGGYNKANKGYESVLEAKD